MILGEMGFGYGSIAGRWVYWREVGSSSYKDHAVLLRERPVDEIEAIVSYAACNEVVDRAPLLLALVLAANLFADAVRDAFDPRSRRLRSAWLRRRPGQGEVQP